MLHRITRAAKLRDSSHQNGEKTGRCKQSVLTRAVLESLETRRLLADVLGTAAAFAALGGSTVTNTGTSAIVGDVGVSPGTAITGFPPGVISGGALHAGDAVATQAETDLATAYGVISGEASAPANNLTGTNMGGLTLTPGVYHFDTAAQLTGALTLDAQGNPNARFDIQIGTTLTTASASAIVLINGAQADNVYFQVGSSATLGTDTAFEGNILAHTAVTLDTSASISQGRALAITGAVTMDTNQVSIPHADISVTDTTATGSVFAGNTIAYTVTVANAGPNDAQTVALSSLIPAGTTFVSDTQTSGPEFTLTNPAVGGTGTISGTIDTLSSGDSASFTVLALVPASAANGATITDTVTVSTDTNDPDLVNNSQTVHTTVATEADLSLTNATAGPALVGDTIAYTVTIANNGPSHAQTVSVSDLLPADTTFVSDSQTSGPAFTLTNPAVGATGTITASIATLASGASAHFTVVARVASSTPYGTTIHNTADITAATADSNMANNSASASIGVGSILTVASVASPLTTASVRPQLSILGADTESLGEAGLRYTWSVAHAPSGAKPVKFSVNGTNSAKNATVRVEKAGTYVLNCVITDNFDNSVTAPVELVIKQVATRLRLTPHARTIAAGAELQYSATALDQFGHAMRTTPTTTYAVKFGDGTINNVGMFTAGNFQSHVLIQMTDDNLIGTLGATIL